MTAASRSAFIVYAALVGGMFTMLAVLVGAGLAMDVDAVDLPVPAWLLVAGTIAFCAFASVVLRRSFTPFREGDADAWWRVNLGRAVALWALAEGGGFVGGIVWLVTGDLGALAVGLAWAMAAFVVFAPPRLQAG